MGSRESPQCEIVSTLCENLKLNAICVMPQGKKTSVIENIEKNKNTIIIRNRCGYTNNLIAVAQKIAEMEGAFYIPFGMDCIENIYATSPQVENVPDGIKRIVVPCGSGMTMCSIIIGLNNTGRTDVEVVGVQVGKDPCRTINKYVFPLENKVKYSVVKSDCDYYHACESVYVGGVQLDKIYEAKCFPFLQKGDLFWIVGHRL